MEILAGKVCKHKEERLCVELGEVPECFDATVVGRVTRLVFKLATPPQENLMGVSSEIEETTIGHGR